MGRIVGIDYGRVRVGLAASDPLHTVATPRETLQVQNRKKLLDDLVAFCAEMEAEAVVVGLPLHMDGRESEMAEEVKKFVGHLGERLPDLDILTWDERLSSRIANQALTEGGVKGKKRKESVDQMAAQLILQSWLDAQDQDHFDDMDTWSLDHE